MNILVAAISLSVVVGVNFKSGHVGICCSGHVSGGVSGQFLGTFSCSGQFSGRKFSWELSQEIPGHRSISVFTMVQIWLVFTRKGVYGTVCFSIYVLLRPE